MPASARNGNSSGCDEDITLAADDNVVSQAAARRHIFSSHSNIA
jgi:hypothetical protein